MSKFEVLAPSGDIEKARWALMYGADAIYIGGKNYSLRANANNFNTDEIAEIVRYAHNLNKRVYVTVNMIFHNEDLSGVSEYLKELDSINVDAVIVSDIAIVKLINDLNLNFEIHLSTQACTTNYESARFWEQLNVKRVVLARECSKEDIKLIKEKTNLELEVFIHGAMCTSYSGRCVLSNYVTLRDSNRGGCSQICRFLFNVPDCDEPFSMSSKDLNMVNYITELMDLGVTSFKIEGRMRSIYYIATVVRAYKNIVNLKLMNKLDDDSIQYYKKVLDRCANRESCPQFYDKLPGIDEQYYSGREEASNQDFLAVVLSYSDGYALIEQRNFFKIGDKVTVFGPETMDTDFIVTEILDENNNPVDAARHPQEKLKIKVSFEVKKFDILKVSIS